MNNNKQNKNSERYGQNSFLVGHPSVKVQHNIPIFISEAIESPNDFAEAVCVLRQLERGDTATLFVSGVGGCVSSVDLWLHEMNKAQELGIEIHVVATGLVASAMTWIVLNASSFELSQGFHALIHNGSLVNGGNFNEYKASSIFHLKYMEQRMRQVYEHFLTEEEINAVLEGKDMWLLPDEWCERFTRRNTTMETVETFEGGEAGE